MRRLGLTIVFLGVLSGCGSTPVDDNYYSLVLAADDVAVPRQRGDVAAHLIVGPVQLPEYLQRRGLAMQFGDNQIRTANHHLWAEPLDEAISKVLVRDITAQAGGMTVDRDAGRWTNTGDCRLRIEFDKFHATDRSTVVSSGRYWLLSSNDDIRREFDVTERLVADGHAHAVSALRQSLRTLANQMTETIRNDSACLAPDGVAADESAR